MAQLGPSFGALAAQLLACFLKLPLGHGKAATGGGLEAAAQGHDLLPYQAQTLGRVYQAQGRSVQALLAPIIGGVGTVFGPLLGALVVKTLCELTKLVAGDAPGLDLVIYGCVLVAVVAFAPRGIAGLIASVRGRFNASAMPSVERSHG